MNISQQTKELVAELNEFTGSKLKNLSDLSLIIETAVNSGDSKLYNDLQFSAKYVNGLSKILQSNMSVSTSPEGFSVSSVSPEEAKDKIRKEFQTNVIRFKELLTKLLEHADSELKTDFENKYLLMTRESFLNLNTLIYDLSWLKKYYNSKRD